MKINEQFKSIRMSPGTLVVFEGLDATGKTTQIHRIQEAASTLFQEPMPYFTHQPSGGSRLGNMIYQITEQMPIHNNLTRQFLHLASHCEHYSAVISSELFARPVFMDRCWISTLAYGYFGGGLNEQFEFEFFTRLVQSPAREIRPNVVFYFSHPYENDNHNTPEVEAGYEQIASFLETGNMPGAREVKLVRVEEGTESEVSEQIVAALESLDLAEVVRA